MVRMEGDKLATHEVASTDCLRGRTIKFAWTQGPTEGKVHEHRFHDDGTVEWRAVDDRSAAGGKPAAGERPEYFAADIGHDACFMSYLSQKSGFTLSLVLNFANRTILGVASNDKRWFRVRGWLEIAATSPTRAA
jgi:hypothetical protein